MAKKSKIAKNEQRRAIVIRYAARAPRSRRLIEPGDQRGRTGGLPQLNRQPRDASAARVRDRDAIDGRPRGYQGAFGISRIRLRAMAHAGELPGVRRAAGRSRSSGLAAWDLGGGSAVPGPRRARRRAVSCTIPGGQGSGRMTPLLSQQSPVRPGSAQQGRGTAWSAAERTGAEPLGSTP